MSRTLPTLALAATLARSTLNCAHAQPSAHETDIPEIKATESVRTKTKDVITLTVQAPFEQSCALAADDPVLTEPLRDNPKLDCQGNLFACPETWKAPVATFPYRQLWPEVFQNRRLSLLHPGHLSLFACPVGSRMVTDNRFGPGDTACLENRFSTIGEKGETCSSGRPDMTPIVNCAPINHLKTVSWECAYDWLTLSDRK